MIKFSVYATIRGKMVLLAIKDSYSQARIVKSRFANTGYKQIAICKIMGELA